MWLRTDGAVPLGVRRVAMQRRELIRGGMGLALGAILEESLERTDDPAGTQRESSQTLDGKDA